MYWDLIRFPLEHEKLVWEARETLRDVEGGPRKFLRIKLRGTRFVQRALIPQVWIGRAYAEDVEVADDGLSVSAYFSANPRAGRLYFGYGGHPELAFGKFETSRVKRLNLRRISPELAMRLKVSDRVR